MTGLFYWLTAILLLGVLIIVHELGHFGAARLCGLRVASFGVGFGPKLWSRTGKDGVEYVFRALPLGGYCRFYGEDTRVADDADALYKQAVWKRALMIVSGPLMNFVMAVVVLFLLYAAVGIPAMVPAVGEVEPGSPAYQAGLLPGDEFLEVSGVPIETYLDVLETVARTEEGQSIQVVVGRGREQLSVELTPRILSEAETSPRIGIRFATRLYRFGLGESVRLSFAMTGESVRSMLDFLRGLIFRGEGVNDMAGPIGAIETVKTETQSGGLPAYLSMAALISLNLGLFNLLPVPALDGSRLLFLGLEAVRRKRVDPDKEGLVHLIGLGALLLLMLPVYIRDIVNLFR